MENLLLMEYSSTCAESYASVSKLQKSEKTDILETHFKIKETIYSNDYM